MNSLGTYNNKKRYSTVHKHHLMAFGIFVHFSSPSRTVEGTPEHPLIAMDKSRSYPSSKPCRVQGTRPPSDVPPSETGLCSAPNMMGASDFSAVAESDPRRNIPWSKVESRCNCWGSARFGCCSSADGIFNWRSGMPSSNNTSEGGILDPIFPPRIVPIERRMV